MSETTSTVIPSFSHDQHHETDAAKRVTNAADFQLARDSVRIKEDCSDVCSAGKLLVARYAEHPEQNGCVSSNRRRPAIQS